MQEEQVKTETKEEQTPKTPNQYSTKVLSTLSSKEFLKFCTLSYILNKNDSAYGREIITHIQEKDALWKPSHGSLYPLLEELVTENVLYIDEEEGKRKYYKLTRSGRYYYRKASREFVESLKMTRNFYDKIAEDILLFDEEIVEGVGDEMSELQPTNG